MSQEPLVSVIVPHFEDHTNLDRCLTALSAQTYDGALEIIIADNCSPSGEARLSAAVAGRARIVIVAERGAGAARNGGVAASTSNILAFTDSDCLPAPDWLREGIAALQRFDVVGGQVMVSTADRSHVSSIEAFEVVFAFDNKSYVEKKGFSVTANLFTSRHAFDAVGGFHNGIPEDLDWCRRAADKGYRIGYAAGALVTHPARRNWPELTRKWRRLALESYNRTIAQPGGRLRWLLRVWVTPLSAFVHSIRVFQSAKLHGANQRLGALAVLFRLRFWRFVEGHRLLLRDWEAQR